MRNNHTLKTLNPNKKILADQISFLGKYDNND